MKINRTMLCIICAAGFSVLLSGCGENVENVTESYVYRPAEETTKVDNGTADTENPVITVNDSWKSNYTAKYTYYNKEKETEKITVVEKRSNSIFSAEDTGSGDMLYYKYNGKSVDSYVIVAGEDEQVHSVVESKTLDDLSSTFMKLSDVDSDLTSLPNVLFMYEDTVAGRSCNKYIQRAYTDGKMTKTVYVWVDREYGFAAKGEVFDENTSLTASWELLEFTVGGNVDSAIEINLSQYKFKEK